ncbi:MAG: M20 family metallo-hydrolase [Ignavibacteriales bacterium]|nr:M20 family metallo-hydrolase [Ignavibacteriales bacterium]
MKLCAIPAIAPSSGGEGEAKKAAFLVDWLGANGFVDISLIKAPDLDAPDGYRPNILAYYRGQTSARTIWIMTHTDVVPPGEMSLWRGNPFKAWVEKGRIYGRGVEDNQQDMVASLYAVKALQAEGITPNCDIGIALVADEETGSRKGIDYVLQNHKVFRRQDLIVVPDAGNETGTMIEVAEKSLLWLKFKVLGKQAHGSTPERGINSFKAGSFFIAALNDLYKIYPGKDKLFDPPISTFEPTKKEANVPNVNTIPGEDVFYMDSRILPDVKVQDVEKTIRTIAAADRAEVQGQDPHGGRAEGPGRAADLAPGPRRPGPQEGRQGRLPEGGPGHGHRRRHRGGRFPPGRLPGGLLVQARRDRPPAERVLHHRQHGRGRQGLRPHLPAGLSPGRGTRPGGALDGPAHRGERRRRLGIDPLDPLGDAHRVEVDVHGVLDVQGVAPGQDHGHGDAQPPGVLDDQLVPLLQSRLRHGQAAELVLLEGIGPGQVDDQVRPELPVDLGDVGPAGRPGTWRRRRRPRGGCRGCSWAFRSG